MNNMILRDNKKRVDCSTGYLLVVCLMLVAWIQQPVTQAEEQTSNLIPNGDFQGKVINDLPEGWHFKTVRPSLAPKFSIVRDDNRQCLYVSGSGNPDCIGWLSTGIKIESGKTYWYRVRFRSSTHLNPLQHLQFLIYANRGVQGIGEFHRLDDNWVEGEGRLCFPGKGTVDAEVRIQYRLCAKGEAWIESISLTETTPLPPRWVRVACTQGPGSLEEYGLKAFSEALDAAGEGKCDLVLLPEYINGEGTTETLSGESVKLMSQKAQRYHMYVAGTIGRYDPLEDRVYNSALLFDRAGKLEGIYDKVHLYGPELYWPGVTPGKQVPVFSTDFGKVGFMTCYDSWFTDVAELVALRGADILLFPNLGYDRNLMHARSLDNSINIITSTRSGKYGVWDATGRDILSISSEPGNETYFKDVVEVEVANMSMLMVTLNLNAPLYQELNGGTRYPVLRSKRYQGNQLIWLEDEILREKLRWWVE